MTFMISFCTSISSGSFLEFFFFFKIYLFMSVLGLYCCEGFSAVGESRGYPSIVVLRPLIAVASLVAELSGGGASVVVACGP